MKNWFIIISLLLTMQISSIFAQQKANDPNTRFEKGEMAEIKDKNRVYVLAYRPYQSENIIKTLQKYQAVQVTNNPDDAEYIIVFDVERTAFNKTSPSAAGAPPSTEDAKYFGHLYVYIPLKTNKNRLVWDVRERYLDSPRIDTIKKEMTWYEAVEKPLISKFLKELKKSRGEK